MHSSRPPPVAALARGCPWGDSKVSVEAIGTPAHCASEQPRAWRIESTRHVWSIERPLVRRFDWRRQFAETAQPASPRTRVNNCTNYAPNQSQTVGHSVGFTVDPHLTQPRNIITIRYAGS